MEGEEKRGQHERERPGGEVLKRLSFAGKCRYLHSSKSTKESETENAEENWLKMSFFDRRLMWPVDLQS